MTSTTLSRRLAAAIGGGVARMLTPPEPTPVTRLPFTLPSAQAFVEW